MKGISNFGSLHRLENISARSGSSQPYTQPSKKCDGGRKKKRSCATCSDGALFTCLGCRWLCTLPVPNTSHSASLCLHREITGGHNFFFSQLLVSKVKPFYGSLEDDQDVNSEISPVCPLRTSPESLVDITYCDLENVLTLFDACFMYVLIYTGCASQPVRVSFKI